MEQVEIKVIRHLVWAFYWRFALTSFATAFIFYMPVLLFAGEADFGFPGTKETNELLPDVTLYHLAGLDHVQAAERTDLMIRHIRGFLARVNKA